MSAKTLFDKIWDRHVIKDLGDGFSLIFVDRHMVNDMAGRGFLTLNKRGLPVAHPEFTFAAADHTVATLEARKASAKPDDNPYAVNLRDNSRQHGFRLFDLDDPDFGIIHVISAEQALALPGTTIACGDSHTCTLGALGAIAWGLGQSDIVHILATQTSVQRKPLNMRINVTGRLAPDVSAKDLILALAAELGVAGCVGHAVEFAGDAIRRMSMDERFTICNMAVEMGARFGLISPDDVTFDYLRGRPSAPDADAWDAAVADWRSLATDATAAFDAERTLDASRVEPQVSWGINPGQTIGISATIPSLSGQLTGSALATYETAVDYSGLVPGAPIAGTPIDIVFIGSCNNARLSDLRVAARVVEGRRVASGVRAWVSPGSERVRREAEAEGLDQIFMSAGFGWGHSGCSMCAGAGDQMREIGASGQRIASTTNRNFVGRQGPGTRTHLLSPAMAAAAAIAGRIVDVRSLEAIGG
ncbi:3-isopropylmalate dehydratase large subunit 1 [Bradyrhizobium sp. SSBR45G]|uniref:3-isopropylmalate dehydratase large subunit n=1 Tax=unclassified Bradyrhizobium TaxID=2631580 RepID=UPI002342AF4D|nr:MULTISPECIES: 3-isopropylmalate dehydratase large subunit [unclassified Bradyrhizobium]GLH76660.1 3-isopropylmalate dehydratase large subunit 1 [Bradyrhizobium sp. SSBR45G]GLH84273.1 3-isopropylmalate dehydratase large subunit 1 [Bradyrhizobium sp. SSBR45R]